MSAFNARLKPKEIFGMPMVAAIGLGVALIFGVLSLLLPLALKLFSIPLMVAGLAFAGLAFFLGDELQWLRVIWLGRIVENKRITSELFKEE